jgi:DNA-binding Xre family transcriptional regulator
VIAMAKKKIAKSLEAYRLERYMSVTEFMKFLGVAPHTYYAAKEGKGTRMSTINRIAGALGVHPSEIAEFVQAEG